MGLEEVEGSEVEVTRACSHERNLTPWECVMTCDPKSGFQTRCYIWAESPHISRDIPSVEILRETDKPEDRSISIFAFESIRTVNLLI